MSCTSCVGPCRCTPTTMPTGPAGDDGWSPVLQVVEDADNPDGDGNSRYVLQIQGWTGGTGMTPTTYVGYYLSTSGPVAAIASATNIRGAMGATGAAGADGADVTTFGYDDSAWVTAAAAIGDITLDSATTGANTLAISAGNKKWKVLGKTLIYHYYFSGSIIFDGGTYNIRFNIKLPLTYQKVDTYNINTVNAAITAPTLGTVDFTYVHPTLEPGAGADATKFKTTNCPSPDASATAGAGTWQVYGAVIIEIA